MGVGRGEAILRTASASRFWLLEGLAVITAIALLGGVLLERVQFYQEQAEKAAMEQMVGALRSSLRLQIAERLRQGRRGLAQLAEQNPMDWLLGKPAHYLGERLDIESGAAPGRSWYFDRRDKSLVYVVGNGRHFVPNAVGHKEVRYQIRPLLGGKPQAERNTADNQAIDGVILVLVEPYQWF